MPQGLGGKPSKDGEEASSPGAERRVLRGWGGRVLRDEEASTSRDKATVFEHDNEDEPDHVETGREVT